MFIILEDKEKGNLNLYVSTDDRDNDETFCNWSVKHKIINTNSHVGPSALAAFYSTRFSLSLSRKKPKNKNLTADSLSI